jgi:hypothetical protein
LIDKPLLQDAGELISEKVGTVQRKDVKQAYIEMWREFFITLKLKIFSY